MRTKRVFALVLMSVLSLACATPPSNLFPPGPGEPAKTIYLVSHGWHAGIVVKRSDIPASIWPQHAELPEAEYLELGWGDMDFYMTEKTGLGTFLKAGLLPTPSVLHIVGFDGPVTAYYPRSKVIRIDLSETGFEQLCRHFENSYARDENGHSRPLGRSTYSEGYFYLSRETYHLFRTCNVWTAKALRAAGFPIRPAANLRVKTLMDNVARFGRVIQAGP